MTCLSILPCTSVGFDWSFAITLTAVQTSARPADYLANPNFPLLDYRYTYNTLGAYQGAYNNSTKFYNLPNDFRSGYVSDF